MVIDIKEIKDIRKQLGLTQGELAKRARVSQSLIAKVEAGRLDPTYSNAIKIFNAIKDASKKKQIKAHEIMSSKMVSVNPRLNIKEAIKKMKNNGFSQLPVIEEHKALGLVSESIILDALLDGKGNIIEDIMQAAPPVVAGETSIEVISSLLQHFPMVLVTKNGKMQGVITKTDILSKMYK